MTRRKVAGTLAILLGAMIEQCVIADETAPVAPAPVPAAAVAYNPGVYPRLNAPLYPSPTQGVPPWTGGTIITNQALAPHEMLYPHGYNAMYGPFYHEVRGQWVITPFGVRQREVWKLEGTRVKVRYRAHRGPFSKVFFLPH